MSVIHISQRDIGSARMSARLHYFIATLAIGASVEIESVKADGVDIVEIRREERKDDRCFVAREEGGVRTRKLAVAEDQLATPIEDLRPDFGQEVPAVPPGEGAEAANVADITAYFDVGRSRTHRFVRREKRRDDLVAFTATVNPAGKVLTLACAKRHDGRERSRGGGV